jgi:phosphoribosylglycinamide formyltransferase-1
MNRIAIFISGEGSNATRMLEDFKKSEDLTVAFVYASKDNLRLKNLCAEQGIAFEYFPWNEASKSDLLKLCLQKNIHWIVLAGFLKLVPNSFLRHFPSRIINIHPSLLPKYGGKGMYGIHVHNAVVAAKEKESGITIHYVDGAYDEGQIIKQFSTDISRDDTPAMLFEKIRALEAFHFTPTVAAEIRRKS